MGRLSVSATRGFTLIELVVVIIILGILSVIAAPKFINLRNDAMMANMQKLKGAIEAAEQLTYAKSAIAGVEKSAHASIDVSGQTIDVTYGYPAVDGKTTENSDTSSTAQLDAGGLLQLIEIPEGWNSRHSTLNDTNAWVFWPAIIAVDAGTAQCFIRYRESTGVGQKPVIDYVTTGCDNY
ncbi:prepilin-type N-terminal cleavage/methylation domain-containing protein [Shewanella avicenniae]|uniref:Prepilin-type N-terminal cleavage/methylation domain-containing protein n=1 Tax=Shewanella avicenniae TaxID=2814294 RepID=A0ABX7QSQ4_9GAMM|nr:prepilin-type N-terminal cleavage/methylation domain-containing protein [Shewanella avicenniae]QSX34499.1 prepilin-type N-terminal cleavage/methylation domain-containing protein [Shewanella avicenniae]